MVMSLFRLATSIPGVRSMTRSLFHVPSNSSIQLAGLTFNNRVGLAAGFDKDGKYIAPLAYLPFGHIEVGTVTPRPQAGNDKPRLFRLPADRALINRMGFNNDGVEALVARLKQYKKVKTDIIIGGNIGKNKDTDLELATDDYIYCFEMLFEDVDYFTVNVSSPNTPGLRSLQEREPLEFLLGTIALANGMKKNPKPIFLKIAPDLHFEQLDEILEICRAHNIDGIIATNTTISRTELKTPESHINAIGNGGLSGAPLHHHSTEIISYIRRKMPPPFVIIGVGGVMSRGDAEEKIKAGADLIQVYTGFIYEGPQLVKALARLQ